LPREEAQVGAVPCPVCDATYSAPAIAPPAVATPAAPDPTANLPADASQLHAAPAVASANAGRVGWVMVFALGVGVGVGGVLGWQAAFRPGKADRETAQAEPPAPKPAAKPGVVVAPLPHEPVARKAEPKVEPTPEPKKPDPPAPPAPKFAVPENAVVVALDDPAATHTVPVLRKGERIVLRGRVKTLRVNGLDAGAILDASALRADNVHVGGKIDGRSTLRVNAPDGVVRVLAPVGGKSEVRIDAPGGEVKFTRGGDAIEGGSTVTITGRNVELRGDVNGIETKVAVNIPGTGSLKVADVRGIATVEYRVAGDGTPEVTAGAVSPTAHFRRID
jgi:hypothetical protein